MAKVTIIGGHGKIALLAAPKLIEAGHEVTSVFRNPEHEGDVAATGAAPVVADVESLSEADMVEVLAGADVVVWSAGAGGGNPQRTYAVDRDAAIASMNAAVEADVQRYVMVSYLGAGPDHGVPEDDSFYPYADAKAAADAHLRGTPLQWTVLGPGALTTDPADGMTYVPAGTRDEIDDASTPRELVADLIVAVVNADPATVAGKDIAFTAGDEPVAEVLARI